MSEQPPKHMMLGVGFGIEPINSWPYESSASLYLSRYEKGGSQVGLRRD